MQDTTLTWKPRTRDGQLQKQDYIKAKAKQQADRVRNLTDGQKAAYAEELFKDLMKQHMPEGVTLEPSAFERALERTSQPQQRDDLGRYTGHDDTSDHSLFDEPVDILPPKGQY